MTSRRHLSTHSSSVWSRTTQTPTLAAVVGCLLLMYGPAAAANADSEDSRIGVDNGGDFPNSGDVLAANTYQLEFNYLHVADGTPSARTQGIPSLLRIGVGRGTELRLGGDPITVVSANGSNTVGTGPYNVGAKYSFWSGGDDSYYKPTACGIQAQVSVPLGNEELHGNSVVPLASLNLDFSMPFGLIIAFNTVGSTTISNGTNSGLTKSEQLSLGHEVGGSLTVFVHGASEYTVGQQPTNPDHQLGGAFVGYLGSKAAYFGSLTAGVTDASTDMIGSGGIAFQF